MAGVQGRVQMFAGLRKFNADTIKQIDKNAQEDVLAATVAGEIEMQNIISTVPSSIVPGKIGRIDTGLMYDSSDADVKKSGRKITGRVGWLKTKKKYFLVQEDGGKLGSIDIVGMHALTAAQERMKAELSQRGIR